MTKRHHRCDDEHCEVHRELTESIKKKTKPKTKKTVKKIGETTRSGCKAGLA